MVAATPSGITLAAEGGAHQSIATPLIGMAQDGLAYFEPAFADELAVIMRWGFEHMQEEAKGQGGSVYLRLSTRTIEQPQREMTPALAQQIVDGGYWMRAPGSSARAVLVYTGALAPEAITATGLLGEDYREIGLLAVTSADRLHAGWSAQGEESHVAQLLSAVPRDCALITVVDGHPATLSWLGGVCGHRTRALGVERFGQTGALQDLYRHYGIDADSLMRSIAQASHGRSPRHKAPVVTPA